VGIHDVNVFVFLLYISLLKTATKIPIRLSGPSPNRQAVTPSCCGIVEWLSHPPVK